MGFLMWLNVMFFVDAVVLGEFSGIAVTTWPFDKATDDAWNALAASHSAMDAVEAGCSRCENDQCNLAVGFGGRPDETGETTLDAMIMDGLTHDVGAVADLRRIKQAISVARAVMVYTKHTMLAGESATRFALEMGFQEVNLTTNVSEAMYKEWLNNNCQPNNRQNVLPDPTKSCGPYKPIRRHMVYENGLEASMRWNDGISADNHDTIGMLTVDRRGHIAGGTSTNGLRNKVPGRVADSPIPGAGAYVEQGIGGAAATGDGDVMMRFLPSFQTVSLMGTGMMPSEAAAEAVRKITKYYPNFRGALIAVDMKGEHGSACSGMTNFTYTYRTAADTHSQFVTVDCISP